MKCPSFVAAAKRSRSYVSCGFAFVLMVALAAMVSGQAKPKKKAGKEPPTQTLPVLPDPPAAVAAETARLAFHVSPLSNKGLLSPQTQEAVKEVMQASRGGRVVKLRAFVAGTGDARRVQTIVSEMFADKKQPLPALTTIQVGALPMEGAQVVLESVSEEKKAVNPGGLAFLAAQHGATAKEAIERLSAVAKAANVETADMLRVTCFLGSMDDEAVALGDAARAFPGAAMDFVERLRGGSAASADCEGVGRLKQTSGDPVQLRNGVALVNTAKLVFSGSQMAFGDKEADLRLAFQRLQKAIEPLGVGYPDVFFYHLYSLTRAVEQRVNGIRSGFFAQGSPDSMLIMEGLPSPDASMAMEVVAGVRN